MATDINIAGRLHSMATGNVVAGADEILDDTLGKKQSVINQDVNESLSTKADAESVDEQLAQKADAAKVSAELSKKANSIDVYTKDETYSKNQLNNLITTPDQEFVTVTATDEITDVTDLLPAQGEADTIYRVGNWDGHDEDTPYDTTCYSEYAWDGIQYVCLDVKHPGIDETPTKSSSNLVESGGVYDYGRELITENVTFKEEASPLQDPDVLKYIIDDDNVLLGYFKTDGSVVWLTDDSWKHNVDEMLSSISSASPYDDDNVLKYIIAENDVCIGVVYKNGAVRFLEDAGWRNEVDDVLQHADVIDALSTPSPYNNPDVLKYITDDEGTCIGFIKKDGTVFMYKAEIEQSEDKAATEEVMRLANIVGLLANGLDNIELSNNPKIWPSIFNIKTGTVVQVNAGNDNAVNLRPCLSIIDDDTIDNQIPDSKGSSEPTSNSGGFFSVLLPLTLSLSAKYHRKVTAGLACEGHRVGLTTFRESNDDYTSLNTNGNAVKWLHNQMGWNVFNHSMTAQLPQRSYFVDGIESALADTILANSYYTAALSFANTCVLDRLTGKWYEPNFSRTAWVERTPTKKYAQLFYCDYNNQSQWYFNRDFDFEYSWGEWFKRADELGLPNEKIIVHNGGTTTVYTISAGRKYAYSSVRTTGTYNNPPLAAAINRIDGDPSEYGGAGYNVWDDAWVSSKINMIQKCIDDSSWVIFMTHFNDQEYWRNYYLDGRSYPSAEEGQPELRGKDNNYSSEWVVPLKNEEIFDVIGANVHDYINHPPSRLGIISWDEWHPAPGTHLAAFYYIMEEAISAGIDIVSPYEGWKVFGNIINIGVDKMSQSYSYSNAETTTPYTDEEKSYLTVGADMSIRYYNSKSNNQ